MARYYFHCGMCPVPDTEAKDGVDAKWFYDDRLGQTLVVSPETTQAISADLRRLRPPPRERARKLRSSQEPRAVGDARSSRRPHVDRGHHMTRVYFHGDIGPTPECAKKSGLGAKWFWDDRLKAFVVDSPGTTRASDADLRRLQHQLRNKNYLFVMLKLLRPDDAENVFMRDPRWVTRVKPRDDASTDWERAELIVRRTEAGRAIIALHCGHCDQGIDNHAQGYCLFDSTSFVPGGLNTEVEREERPAHAPT